MANGLTKTVTLERQELEYLRHWHTEQASFQTQMGREQQAEWHRARLKALDSSAEPKAPLAGSQPCVCLKTCAAAIGAGMDEGVHCRRVQNWPIEQSPPQEDCSTPVPQARMHVIMRSFVHALDKGDPNYNVDMMNKLSLLWVAPYGESGGNMLTSIEPQADKVIVKMTLHEDYL